jgi:hypothetical protein
MVLIAADTRNVRKQNLELLAGFLQQSVCKILPIGTGKERSPGLRFLMECEEKLWFSSRVIPATHSVALSIATKPGYRHP